MNIKKVINHKYFHYAAVVLMIFNIIGYISIQSIECVLVFGATAYAANHFTENRALDILIGLFASNVLFGCGRVKENFTEGHSPEEKEAYDACIQAGKKWVEKSERESDGATIEAHCTEE